MISQRSIKLGLLPALMHVLIVGHAFGAPLTQAQQAALIQRFAPLIKTSFDDGSYESLGPANWDWFASRSTLVWKYNSHACVPYGESPNSTTQGTEDFWPDGDVVVDFEDPKNAGLSPISNILSQACADLRTVGSCPHEANTFPDPRYALHMDHGEDHAGEAWTDVIHQGHGIYAHLEQVPGSSIVNIEYTIVWAYNGVFCDYHEGDITSVVVDYDSNADLLVRAMYSVHGYGVQEFDVSHAADSTNAFVSGQAAVDGTGGTYLAVKLNFPKSAVYSKGGTHFGPSDPYLYLIQDPVTHRYEHVAVFAEHGGHELWPNTSGSVTDATKHTGDGLSFIPEKVQSLGSVAAPAPDSLPLVYLNGFFGSDPASLALHRTWFWPMGRKSNPYAIPEPRFSDGDLYDSTTSIGWPPNPYALGVYSVVYVSNDPCWGGALGGEMFFTNGATQFDGTQAKPFPNPDIADSFVTPGGTIMIQKGVYATVTIAPVSTVKYTRGLVLNRPAILKAIGGAVVLGGKMLNNSPSCSTP
jgi:hypothetical protein